MKKKNFNNLQIIANLLDYIATLPPEVAAFGILDARVFEAQLAMLKLGFICGPNRLMENGDRFYDFGKDIEEETRIILRIIMYMDEESAKDMLERLENVFIGKNLLNKNWDQDEAGLFETLFEILEEYGIMVEPTDIDNDET